MYDNWNAPGEPKKHTKFRITFFLFLVIIVMSCSVCRPRIKESGANQFSDDFMEAASVNVVNWAEPFLR